MGRRGRPMNGGACRTWRGDLAARALDRDDPARRSALGAHLDGCAACRADLDELRAVADAVALADIEHLVQGAVDPAVGERVVARIAEERRAAARRRRVLALAGAAVIAALIGVALGVGRQDRAGPTGERVDLAGPAGATGSATLIPRAWGTEVSLTVDGLGEGEVYWLWLSTDEGERVVAGTLTGTGATMTAVLAAALPTEDAVRVWMTDDDEGVVLDSRAAQRRPG